MTTKLTLTIEQGVIDSAKKYAQEKGKSLSNLVENYLKTISSSAVEHDAIDSKVKKLQGVIRLSDDFNYKENLRQSISKKYS